MRVGARSTIAAGQHGERPPTGGSAQHTLPYTTVGHEEQKAEHVPHGSGYSGSWPGGAGAGVGAGAGGGGSAHSLASQSSVSANQTIASCACSAHRVIPPIGVNCGAAATACSTAANPAFAWAQQSAHASDRRRPAAAAGWAKPPSATAVATPSTAPSSCRRLSCDSAEASASSSSRELTGGERSGVA